MDYFLLELNVVYLFRGSRFSAYVTIILLQISNTNIPVSIGCENRQHHGWWWKGKNEKQQFPSPSTITYYLKTVGHATP